MTETPDSIVLGPEDEAKRLWKGYEAARERAGESGGGDSGGTLVSLCEALDLGLRTAEILVTHRLQDHRASFPATIQLQLELPVAEVDVIRDAVNVPQALSFTEMLDLLSEESLECVGPHLHRGWEDRRFSCQRSRRAAREAVGVTLGAQRRNELLLLAAYRNRLFRYPPPVRVVTADIIAAFGALEELVRGLL